jgi:hypothetical protein
VWKMSLILNTIWSPTFSPLTLGMPPPSVKGLNGLQMLLRWGICGEMAPKLDFRKTTGLGRAL